MNKQDIIKKSESIAKSNNFKIDEIIYTNTYYTNNNYRDIIYSGLYQGKSAVLKYYNDPRPTDESISQLTFLKNNKSKILTAPQIYKHKIISPNEGWIIMEKLADGSFYKTPMNKGDRQSFLQIYYEYRCNFPTKPTRELSLPEKLPANERALFSVRKWLELASQKDLEAMLNKEKRLLDNQRFNALYLKSIDIINKELNQRQAIWCHGHFKPQEIYYNQNKKIYYLTDFADSRMFYEGYEFGFIIWADWLMNVKKNITYPKFESGINFWIKDLEPIANKLKIKNYHKLIIASLIERTLGAILADIYATDKTILEKEKYLKLFFKLLDNLIKKY